MLANILIVILLAVTPLSLFNYPQASFSKPTEANTKEENLQENKEQWEAWMKYQQSSVSALLRANPNFLPVRDWDIEEIEIEAKAAFVFKSDNGKSLYQKNSDEVLPIASLTKLMTAILVLDHLRLDKIVTISNEALTAYGDQGNLKVNEKISVRSLLYALLMESSNDAAMALAESVEEKTGQGFVKLMNDKAKEFGLEKTSFADASGFEPTNVSTAREVAFLIKRSFEYSFIWKVLETPIIDLFSADGKINHHWINTNKLLGYLNVVGGKTGYTDYAGGCLGLAIKNPAGSEYIITVVLGSEDRFTHTEKLITWAKKAYRW